MTMYELNLLIEPYRRDIRFRAACAGAKLPDDPIDPPSSDEELMASRERLLAGREVINASHDQS